VLKDWRNFSIPNREAKPGYKIYLPPPNLDISFGANSKGRSRSNRVAISIKFYNVFSYVANSFATHYIDDVLSDMRRPS
jgi:hypothetical protein